MAERRGSTFGKEQSALIKKFLTEFGLDEILIIILARKLTRVPIFF